MGYTLLAIFSAVQYQNPKSIHPMRAKIIATKLGWTDRQGEWGYNSLYTFRWPLIIYMYIIILPADTCFVISPFLFKVDKSLYCMLQI